MPTAAAVRPDHPVWIGDQVVAVAWRVAAAKEIITLPEIRNLVAKGERLAGDGQYEPASQRLGLPRQYAQWSPETDSLEVRDRAPRGLHGCL